MKIGALSAVFLSAVVAIAASARAQPAPDFDAAAKEATAFLQAYLRIDTTNPPGNERRAADFFKAIFDREGIENEVFDQGGNRADILARLPGTGAKRPVLLVNHMDVVPAQPARWKFPPFSGEIRDGILWGRGATDMKGTAICHLMTMVLLKRSGRKLDRDVLFLGTADEEEGGEDGVDWMVAHAREKLRGAEFVLTEGNTISVEDGRTRAWNVDVTEKSNLWLRVIATGKGGHASIPEPDGAVNRLIRALGKILAYEPPIRLISAVDHFFRESAKTAPEELQAALADPAGALADPRLREMLLADPIRAAYLRPTIAVTGLSGSSKVNVIPGEASATIDCRLLPGDDPATFLETLKGVAGDASLRFEVISSSRATASPIDTELFRSIVRARDRFEPDVPVLTPPLTSTTDATRLREIGMVVYGFEPFRLSEDDDRSHGDDERLSLANLRFGLEVTWTVVADIAGVSATGRRRR
jgi:acetylornithine deacetylase/succinyl-diaminopimelate desuccinylase-like protein